MNTITSSTFSDDTRDNFDVTDQVDVLELISRDHKPIKKLLKILLEPKASWETKQPAFEEFTSLLLVHARAEGESLYESLKNEKSLRMEALKGDAEHAMAEQLIGEVREIENDNNLWTAKVSILAHMVEEHIEEEESELFKKVKKEFETEARKQIGEVYAKLMKKYGNSVSQWPSNNQQTMSSFDGTASYSDL